MTGQMKKIEPYLMECEEELRQLTETLCRIPAPSGCERARAEFCKQWLEKYGATEVRLDEADNAVLELHAKDSHSLTVFMAHTDTVFPDTESMAVQYENGRMCCPGVCDDTANLAVLLMAARFLLEQGIQPANGLLVVANSGEEGLGNLRGCRQLMKDYKGRIAQLISFDGSYTRLWNQAVGSTRYRVTIRTEGGHSFRNFGNQNAIVLMSQMISELYNIRPVWGPEGSTTTYNVGVIRGGTSVNTVAQEASVLYEYRSDAAEGLRGMERAFRSVVESWQKRGVEIDVELLGVRPCAEGLDPKQQQGLTERFAGILESHTGKFPIIESASTDCNMPLSLGIPAVSFGVCDGGGAHTREEWLEVASLRTGLRIALDSMLQFCE